MNSKRILFILPTLRSGGAERQAVTIAVLLKQLGYDVEFLVYFNGDFYEPTLQEAGIRVHRKVCSYLHRMAYVTNRVRKGRYNAVISFMPTPNFLNCFAALFGKRGRVIISERSSKERDLISCSGRIKGKFYKKADAIVCNSVNSRIMWEKHHPEYKSKLSTIYNTVMLGRITSDYVPFNGGRLNIVVAATISNIKNPMGLIDSLVLLNDQERHSLHIDWYGKKEAAIGDHAEYDKVVAAIEARKLADVISLHEATNDIANRMNEADCIALFSKLEGLPNVICEGMMVGKPIVMSRCSDYSILVEEGINGYLCDWDNPQTIKKALVNMAAVGKNRIIEMGAESKSRAVKLFERETVIKQWEHIIAG